MNKLTLLLPLLLAAALISSCARSSPQSRIANNPQLFATLPPDQQAMVASGQIAQGLPKQGVVLAWGPPDRTGVGQRDGIITERWDYYGTRPIFQNNFNAFGGWGWGRRAWRWGGFGIGPTITYVPVRQASVWFRDDIVTQWEHNSGRL